MIVDGAEIPLEDVEDPQGVSDIELSEE